MASSQQQQKRSSSPSRALALLTALSVATTLLYVFILLVPAWRLVTVDRDSIGDLLANTSSNGGGVDDDLDRLWEALAHDPLLRSRSINVFRECLIRRPTKDASEGRNGSRPGEGSSNQPSVKTVAQRLKSTTLALGQHLLETLAGSFQPLNSSTTVNITAEPESILESGTGSDNDSHSRRHTEDDGVRERCWFLDLQWSSQQSSSSMVSGLSSLHLLYCSRALFLLAVCLLLFVCAGLTGALYACFAAGMPAACRFTLLIAHGLSLTQLVALAILQDSAATLETQRLRDLLAQAEFPVGSEAAVTARRGALCLALLCVLCCLTGAQMLLLLVLRPRYAASYALQGQQKGREQQQQQQQMSDAGKAECDDAEDTNPLI